MARKRILRSRFLILSASISNMKERHPFKTGMLQAVPLTIINLTVGIPFGILATKAGISPFITILMSTIVNAATSQFVAVQMITAGAGFMPILCTIFVINLRHLLLSTSIGHHLPKKLNLLSLVYIAMTTTDETFGLNISKVGRNDKLNTSNVYGTNFTDHFSWIISTVIGIMIGKQIIIPTIYIAGIIPVMFAGLLATQLKETRHWVYAAASVTTAVLLAKVVSYNWLLILTTLIVSTLATMADFRKKLWNR